MSSKVWSGARITQPMPSRNTARMTGAAAGLPIATALRVAVDHVVAAGGGPDGSSRNFSSWAKTCLEVGST